MAKGKPPPPKKKEQVGAPLWIITYCDMIMNLLCFMIMILSQASVEPSKYQAQIGLLEGSLGIGKLYQFSPIQQNLPAPIVKVDATTITNPDHAVEQSSAGLIDSNQSSTSPTVEGSEDDQTLGKLRMLGVKADLDIQKDRDDVILILPTYGIFDRVSYEIDSGSPEVQRLKKIYSVLAEQIAALTQYDIVFIGHTDSVPVPLKGKDVIPRNNVELGFLRAIAMYDFFFKDYLKDKTRIVFASQGDNIPLIPDAKLDSELRKNRRVEIHLKRKKMS